MLSHELCEILAPDAPERAATTTERAAVLRLCQQGLRRLPEPVRVPSKFHGDVSSRLRVR